MDFDDFADDLMENSWDGFEESDDMEMVLVPEDVESRGLEAVDNFIHKQVMKNMDKDVYNGE